MNNTNLSYKIENRNNVLDIKVSNLMYEFENQIILDEINSAIDLTTKQIILDLKDARYINSMGLRFLISLLKTAKSKNITFTLKHVSQDVRQLFKITKLEKMFLPA